MMTALRNGVSALLVLLANLASVDAAPDLQQPSSMPQAYSAAFREPLVPTGKSSASEDVALYKAIEAYRHRTSLEDVSSLTAYLADHPHSVWASALSTNLAYQYLDEGYFSRAVELWNQAWTEGKTATDPSAKALVDGAVGELARLRASLGQTEELTALFEEIGQRAITGSATEAMQVAREQLTHANADPGSLFLCGPGALRALLLANGASRQDVAFLRTYRASELGTNLAELARLADRSRMPHRLVRRSPGQQIPVPSIIHWKVGHFAAIVGETGGRFHVQDVVLGTPDLWVTRAAIDAEASGYFLVPATISAEAGWQDVGSVEAAGIWGKGETNGVRTGDAGDILANGPAPENGPPRPDLPSLQGQPAEPKECPLCVYNIKEATVGLTLSDTPVGYSPPIGPSAKVRISYNQREDSQPANFSFFNLSPKWTINWLSYVTYNSTQPGISVSRYLPGGGAYYYTGYDASSGRFAAQDDDGSILVLASQSPTTFRRLLPDGSSEFYAESDGSSATTRRVFLSSVSDPQGNTLVLNYDGQQRLMSLTDAVGRQTTFSYDLANRPLLVTAVTDPFGRKASLNYDANGRLSSITDIIGLISSFTYDANGLVNRLTTPYGITNFAYTAPGTTAPPRFVQVTDPLGYKEREEWREPSAVANSDPAATVPTGMPVAPVNEYLTYRNSFHWDKDAYGQANCTDTGGCDYLKARIRHFLHVTDTSIKSTTIESVKYPLENRIWFSYPQQTLGSSRTGSYNKPIAIGRVLDDGTTQLSRFTYDTSGLFNLTRAIDPVGRTTSYGYANQVDLTSVSQTTEFGVQKTIAQFLYNDQHRPTSYIDAAGKLSSFTYNAAGQLTSSTNPLGQKTEYHYDGAANLLSVINANGATAATFTYDGFNRVRTFADSEGWSVTYDYDAADRLTKATYPDGTAERYAYDRLDLSSYENREGRIWTYTHDANRRLTKVVDPMGAETQLAYNGVGQLVSLTDPKGNVTSWSYDVQGRQVSKTYADQSTVSYTYESTTSRLKSALDALGQTKAYGYAKDDRLTSIGYLNAVNPTPDVSFVYDKYFPRLASMTDGAGVTSYSYYPTFSNGALQLQKECFTAIATSGCAHEIDYGYDEIGRFASRTISGSNPETFQYDAIGRLINHSSDLGAFELSYLGQTSQLTTRQLLPATSTLKTSWSYLDNAHDRRLAGIANSGLVAGQYTNFAFETTPENFISGITQTSDAAIAEPTPTTQTIAYNNLNQITAVSGQPYSYDANGNLLSDGERSYSWDAEDRLVGVVYSGQPGKQTSFAYDGFGRRIEIKSMPVNGDPVTTTVYLWCGIKICQGRDTNNVRLRSYFDQGEVVEGEGTHPLYYGVDQLGSVRRVFAADGSAPTYDFDPYGVPLQSTASLTDFGYARMFSNAENNLNLTLYRAYNPQTGVWLSRDPLAEAPGIAQTILPLLSKTGTPSPYGADGGIPDVAGWSLNTNFVSPLILYGKLTLPRVTNQLYGYVNSDPLSQIDPEGNDFRKIAKICYMILSWEDFPEPPEPVSPENPAIRITMTPPKAPNGPPYGPKFIIQR